MKIYQRSLEKLATTGLARWTLARVLAPLDMRFKDSRLAPSRFGVDFPLCFLTTKGRSSGKPRTVPLFFVENPLGRPTVAATNFGQEHHPSWALNLEADPHATVEIEGTSQDVVARNATSSETAELWPLFDGVWPGYETYRDIAPRDIKVFILE